MGKILEKNEEKKSARFNIIAGPCSIESLEQVDEIGKFLVENKIEYFRGGVFKPRTRVESFQGLGSEAYSILKYLKDKYKLKVVSEVMDPRELDRALEYIDIVQIGTRNMYNYPLLKELGKLDRPVLLKRGLSATIEEWIEASKYIRSEGNDKVIMCERGVRSFDNYTRNMLDLMAIPIIKNETELPIIIDPSHGTGRRELIEPALKAAKALGADGAMVEIHPNPDKALSDGEQSLELLDFKKIIDNL